MLFSKKLKEPIFCIAFTELPSSPPEGRLIPASPARLLYPPRAPEMLLDELTGTNKALDSYILGKRRL